MKNTEPDEATQREIVEKLRDLLFSLTPEYFRQTFHSEVEVDTFDLDQAYVFFAEEGNVFRGTFGSIGYQWWEINRDEIKPIRCPPFHGTHPSDPHARIPKFKVLVQGDHFATGETYCFDFICRRVGSFADLRSGKPISQFPITLCFGPDYRYQPVVQDESRKYIAIVGAACYCVIAGFFFFIATDHADVWQMWMRRLLAVSCLIAAAFVWRKRHAQK